MIGVAVRARAAPVRHVEWMAIRNQRLGLLMVGASLLVIAIAGALLFQYQRVSRTRGIRIQGVAIARILARLPAEFLTPTGERRGALDLARSVQSNADFAYIAVVDPGGRPRSLATAPGVSVPAFPVASAPAAWFGERVVADHASGREYREFFAPVIQNGKLAAHVRVGFVSSGLEFALRSLPSFAWLALAIFLLTPIFYYLVRREIRPLRLASERIESALDAQCPHAVELTANGEIGEFVHNFNRAIRVAEARTQAVEEARAGALTEAKVLSFQKARIESVLESLPAAVLVLDECGVVTFANAKLDLLTGYDRAGVLGRKAGAWCEDRGLVELLARYEGRSGRSGASESTELTPQRRPEQRLSVTTYPLFAPKDGSEIFGTLVVLVDVSGDLRAREARKEMVAHLAHELKSPLQVIGMYAEALREDQDGSQDMRIEAGNVIHDEVERITSLVGNLLGLGRIELGGIELQRRFTRIDDLLKDTFEAVARRGKDADLHFRLDLGKGITGLNVDKALLRVAVNNLLTNAIKYNRPGGEVVLGAHEAPDEIQIFVRDTGLGIAHEDQARIFDKFYRSSHKEIAAIGGHGLGLALAREIVELHHGKISVTSSPGEGSEFTIRFQRTPLLLQEAM